VTGKPWLLLVLISNVLLSTNVLKLKEVGALAAAKLNHVSGPNIGC